jgi:hypothetical protein
MPSLCSSVSAALLVSQCPFAQQHCVRAAKRPCAADADAQCMMCPTLSVQGGYDVRDGVCVACKDGHYYNASYPVEGRRCVKCAPNFYCPSKEKFMECEGIQIFKRESQYLTVPLSTEGSVTPADCSCSRAGGFEKSYASQGLFGCTPCAAGFYSLPNNAASNGLCTACPLGSWSLQSSGLTDYRR